MPPPTRTETLEGDRALLDAFRRGERAALERVFDLYVQDVAKTVRAGVVVQVDGRPTRLGADLPEHEAESLVQETFARAFAQKVRDGYDGVRPFGAYLATIARNLIVDRGRRAQRSARVFARGVDVEQLGDDGPAADPAERLEQKQLAELLTSWASTLGEPERSIFKLRYEGQKSHRETAADLGLSEIQIRRRDTRLRAELLEHLRAHGFFEHARVSIGKSLLGRKG